MKRQRGVLVVCAALALLGRATALLAADEKQGPILVVTEENDLFSNPFTIDHQDRHYTQGLKITYLGGSDDTPDWVGKAADVLPAWGMDVKSRYSGWAFGQNMYTPEDLTTSALITNDRPYGGWLYLGGILQREGVTGQRTDSGPGELRGRSGHNG